MPKTTNDNDELFSEAGKVQFEYFKFENPGDKISGIYVGKYSSISQKYGYEQMNYVLLTPEGKKMIVSGRNATKTNPIRIIFGMEKIPLGAKMGFIYTGDKDTGKGNPAKLIEPRYLGQRDEEALKKFQEMYNLEEVKSATDEELKDETTVEDLNF